MTIHPVILSVGGRTGLLPLSRKFFPKQFQNLFSACSLHHESESTFIPAGTKHRLANEGKLPLKIVEIQVGATFGQDDINRLTDDFGCGEK